MSSTPDALWSAPSLRVLSPDAVSVTGLRRRPLLDDCSLRVPVGMRLLLVGEPEASASMLIRVLAGLSRPRAGHIRIAGLTDASADGWGRRVAHLGPDPGIPGWMTPREALSLAASLLGLSGAQADRRIERAVAWSRILSEWLDRPIRRGGPPLVQRTGLATALLGDPEVLLLDEPLRAVDADERSRLLRLPGARRTVLLASRYPASERGLVSHVALIRNGRVRFVAPVADVERAGLPLSVRGIEAFGEQQHAGTPAPSIGRSTAATR